jgi:transcription-repair coupling factor (superfamily II helicase)
MQPLLDTLRQLPAYTHLLASLQAGKRLLGLGLPTAARLPVLAALYQDLQRPILLVTDRADHALALTDELAFWLPDVPCLNFNEPTPLFYEQAAWGSATRRGRLQALTALASYHLPFVEKPILPPVLIASARALMTRTLPRRDFLKACRLLRIGQMVQPEILRRAWLLEGYQAVDTVLEPGQFSHRGGILDIWPAAEHLPVRIDFFGDEIDTLRRFDPATQRTVENLEAVLITPAREYLLSDTSDSGWQVAESNMSEFYIPVLHPLPASLLDYLPQNAWVFVEDVSLFESMVVDVEEQAVKFRQESVAEGTLSADFPIPYLSWPELEDSLYARHWVELGYSGAEEETGLASSLSAQFGQLERFAGRLKPFIEYLAGLVSDNRHVFVVTRQRSRLQELWLEQQPRLEPNLPLPRVTFVEGSLSGGWQLADTVLITDSEIFGWARPQPRTRQPTGAETPEAAYADLSPGDYVVHIDHGIGKYIGLVRRHLDGLEREFLCVEYQDGDQLFVPIHQADRLTRYVGAEGTLPALDHLGGVEWHATKGRVKEAVQQVAQELLDLYARRQIVRGYAFSPDTAWQKELEDSFPYIETEDQVRALKEIKQDMEAPRPMDRLLCGDVGYGKTEVALRAAFKAVVDGRQVAVLVPTTVLAQQHYETFRQRLAAFPVTVEMLSRFRSPREQSQVLSGLAQGTVDIVIGTHRLLQPDVQFKDLGLVVIDEEQRFGVTHKEHFKKLRTEVDVLTLTATPIPRTLYMALTGVRDISNLNTPPDERLPVVTHVGPYSPRLVRQAILRELERGGQVFFVHNRVQTIHAMRMHLEKLVPEARIAVAHGQMPEHELALAMQRFNAGEVDVLLATSIIESGLDIPNANTLIVDRGDTFGLAQLYQLRGRVGRGAVRAYAYIFRHRKKPPTADGRQRLEVIAENTQLGAGYSIAMRDLEIRGAGELLGSRQHGHIQAVGFHLYTRLLADAVRRLRAVAGGALPPPAAGFDQFSAPLSLPVNVDLPLAIGIPSDYIPNQDLRLRLYRRLADLRDEAEIEALASEFEDRFGPLPEMTANLFYQMRVKLRAERAGLASVGIEGGQIALRYPPPPDGSQPKPLRDLNPQVRGGKNAYWCTFMKEPDWQERLLEVLGGLPVFG